jgi:hypothetical protein
MGSLRDQEIRNAGADRSDAPPATARDCRSATRRGWQRFGRHSSVYHSATAQRKPAAAPSTPTARYEAEPMGGTTGQPRSRVGENGWGAVYFFALSFSFVIARLNSVVSR